MCDITFNKLVSLAELFHPETFYDETSWLDLGKILYHHQHNYFNLLSNQIMLDTWINISKRTPGFEKTAHDDCTIEWKNFIIDHYFIVTSNQYNYESLINYVKMDNPEGYAIWEEDQIKLKRESSTNKYRNQFDKFREECIDENFLYTRAITIDQIYKHYNEWRNTDDNTKITKKIFQEFMVDKYGPIQYCKTTFDFGWSGICLKDIQTIKDMETASEPLIMDITEQNDVQEKSKISFKLRSHNYNFNRNVFEDEYDTMEKQPCEMYSYVSIPGGKGLDVKDYNEIENNEIDKSITYKSTNHVMDIINDTESENEDYIFTDKGRDKLLNTQQEIKQEDYDSESQYLHEEDFLGKEIENITENPLFKVQKKHKNKNYRKKSIKKETEACQENEEDNQKKEKGIHKKKKADPIHKSSVRRQIKSYIKHTTEKCDDGYISLDMLRDDYNNYCYYRGIPREQYFDNIVENILGEKKSFYIDGDCYKNLFWGYKFKSMKSK